MTKDRLTPPVAKQVPTERTHHGDTVVDPYEWLRAKAETENVRRRSQEDVAKAHRYGLESFAGALLAVKDSLDAALTVENTSVESFKEGVELTARQLESVFQKFHVTVIDPQGQKFDPHRHQAISQVESDLEPGSVVTVLQKGYLLHDRVLRPALVIVGKEKSAPPKDQSPESPQADGPGEA